mmetsp:Transcript_6068/g.9932  ORF Transcript_6068/g.9932 Transcript_6068/m.9932 type:complete len:426 (+) Transcript_6068:137-1414(+)
MVEGPGATRNGRKAQVLIGKVVSSSAPLLNPCHAPLVGCTLIEAFTVGKEMFLIFNDTEDDNDASSDTAIRLHFGMNGSFRTRKVANLEQQPPSSSTPHWKQNDLKLYFENGINSGSYTVAEAWDTTVNYPVSASSARDKFTNLSSRDVCSVLFNAQNVFTSLRQLGSSLNISDALLNQEICPGVGNIIKIESLHRSTIDPRRMMGSIADIELRRLIRHARQYSMDWLKTGRAGTKLVYNQTVCGTCKGMTIKMQKIGGSSTDGNSNSNAISRVTFWCTACQPFNSTPLGSINGTMPSLTAGNQGTILGRNPTLSNRTQPQCPQHGHRATKLSRVRKEGANILRIFFTCKMKSCQYFHWADGTFPSCQCGKKTILRISKTKTSGGRWFLCCAGGGRGNNNNGCGHFTWATNDHLDILSTLLTPLL